MLFLVAFSPYCFSIEVDYALQNSAKTVSKIAI